MKYDICFVQLVTHLSYLDSKFKKEIECIPSVGDYVDYEIWYKGNCVLVHGKVIERVHYLQDNNVELRVFIEDEETLEDLRNYVKVVEDRNRKKWSK
jgi:hypothetical protein